MEEKLAQLKGTAPKAPKTPKQPKVEMEKPAEAKKPRGRKPKVTAEAPAPVAKAPKTPKQVKVAKPKVTAAPADDFDALGL